jgi:hypothetical protein
MLVFRRRAGAAADRATYPGVFRDGDFRRKLLFADQPRPPPDVSNEVLQSRRV